MTPIRKNRAKRPFLTWAVCLVFSGLVILGWIRVQQVVQNWGLVADYTSPDFPIYPVISGAIWGLAGIPVVVGLWMRRKWAVRATWAAAIFYPLTFWLERFFLLKSPTRFTNWPFDAGATLFWLVVVALALYLPGGKRYLGR